MDFNIFIVSFKNMSSFRVIGIINTYFYIVCICATMNNPCENILLWFPQRLAYPYTIHFTSRNLSHRKYRQQ